MSEKEIREKIWNGSLPLKVVLASNETRGYKEVEYLFIAKRLSYLPQYLPAILQYFKPFLNNPELASDPAWWFVFEDVPVRWNWPIGLSFDLLTGLDPFHAEKSYSKNCPWTLVLHYKDYPTDYLLSHTSDNTLPEYWNNQCKEACVIRDGQATKFMNLSKENSIKLWSSVVNHTYEDFWLIMDRMISYSRSSIRHIPLKIYMPISNKVVQIHVGPMINEEEPQTLGTALNANFPDIFPSKRTCILARPVLHGVVVPLSATLVDLLCTSMYTDGFLHISLVMMS